MKKVIPIIIFSLIFSNLKSQEIINVDPDNSVQGESIDLTITGQSTHFMQATNTTLWFSQGSSTILDPVYFDVQNDNSILANFSFSLFDPSGDYNINVNNSIDGDITLENGFLLNENPTPPQLISISPDKSPRNQSITLSISGQNTNFNQATNVVWLNQGNSTIQAVTFKVITNTEIQADFAFNISDSVGYYKVNVYNDFDGDLYLENSFTLDYGTFISYNELNNILVFPNPTKGDFRIDNIPNLNCTINIITMEGKIIKTYHNNNNYFVKISLSNLKGYYFVRISNNDFQVTRKILIID